MSGTLESSEFQLPRRVIRKLLRGRWRRRARNVLIVANQCADMVSFLNRRGVDAFGIDDGQTPRDRGFEQVHSGSVAGGFPFPPHAFDIVLVGNCRAFEHGLNGPEPLIAMANLLSSLRTRSRLVWLQPDLDPVATDADERMQHPAQQLSHFPGHVDVDDYHDGWERYLSLEWLIGRHREFQLQVTTLTIPGQPICRLNWHQHAREAALRQSQTIQQERAA